MTFNLSGLDHINKVNHMMIGGIIILMLAIGAALVMAMRYQPSDTPVWRIAITSWPGFDYLYLAEKKGFFKEQGLNIRLIPINSLTDMRTAYGRGIIDGYTGTIMDVVESIETGAGPSRIVLVTDYSNGGDQLLVTPSITTVADLKGARFGIEITSSVERYMLRRALEGSGITESDLDIRPYTQTVMVELAMDKTLDAILTYEPFASRIQARRTMNVLFDSSKIPEEILDLLIVSGRMFANEPDLSRRLQQAWQSALDYANAHPEETSAFFAQRYGISLEEYKALSDDLKLFTRTSMQRLASSGGLHQAIHRTAATLDPSQQLPAATVSATAAVWFQQEARP